MRVFDAHFHVIDPRFPLVPNQGYLPEPFTVDDYRATFAADGGAVVSGSFQAYDQTYLIDALQRLGPGFVGVANVPPDISDDEVLELAAAGVRAWRINLVRGGDATNVEERAQRYHALAGWHLEIYANAKTAPAPRRPALRDRPPRHRRAPGTAATRRARRPREGLRVRPRAARHPEDAARDRRRQP